MKRLIITLCLMALLLVSSVFAIGMVDLSVIPNSQSGDLGDSILFILQVKNTDAPNSTIPGVLISSTPLILTGTSYSINKPFADETLADVNATQSAIFNVVIPNSGIQSGRYIGTITATEIGNASNNKSVTYQVVVNDNSISSVGIVDISVSPVSTNTGNLSASIPFTLQVKNTNAPNSVIPNVKIESTDLISTSDATYKITKPTFANAVSVNATQTFPFNIVIPSSGVLAGTYRGTITATEVDNPSNNKSVPYLVIVNAQNGLTASVSEVKMISPADSTAESVFRLTNTGTTILNNIVLSHDIASLNDSSGKKVTLQFFSSPQFSSLNTIASLAPGASTIITLKAVYEYGMKLSTFEGYILANATVIEAVKIPLIVKTQPASCAGGVHGSILSITVEKPDNGDEFEPGDEFTAEVTIANSASSDKDVNLEAQLYNIDKGKKIDTYKSSKTIDSDDEETFVFKMKMDENIKSSDSYKLFIKAYEDDHEDSNCVNAEVSLDLNVPDDKLVVESFTISPTTATCKDDVEALLQIKNAGGDDQDNIKVKLVNTYLGLSKEVALAIDSGSSGNVGYARIVFSIPDYVKDGVYKVLATVYYAGNSIPVEKEITLKTCQPAAVQPVVQQQTQQQTTPQNTNLQTTTSSQVGKDVLDFFNKGIETPSSFWLLADVLLFLGIIAVLVAIVMPRRH